MPDPVSWLVVERGWAVLDRSGEQAGTVDEVLGDKERDIFDGLALSTGALSVPRYLPSEHVGTILEGEVHTDLTSAEVAELGDYAP
jgi:hypothetical protein